MNRPVVVLGATGSIGSQTLEVARQLGLDVVGLAARSPSPALLQAAGDHPSAMVVATGGSSEERAEFSAAIGDRAKFGTEALLELAVGGTPAAPVAVAVDAGLTDAVAAFAESNDP